MPVSSFDYTGGSKQASSVNQVDHPTAHELAQELASLGVSEKTSHEDWNAIKTKVLELIALVNQNESGLASHNHDSRYYTEAETDTLLGAKANSSALTAHTGDGTIHFTEGSINHANIQGIGTNSHAQIDTHITDGTIHLDQSDVETIGDARYERTELTFTALTLAATTTITVTAGVLRFMRTLNINTATDPTIAISGSPVSGVFTVKNTSGSQRQVTLPLGDRGGDGDTQSFTIEDTEKYEVNYLNDGEDEIWFYRKLGTIFS